MGIFEYIMNGDLKSVKNLIDSGFDINTKDVGGWSPLQYATYCDHLDIVEYLISKGVDIESKDNSGITSLVRSVINNKTKLFKYLISVGTNVNTQDFNGDTPLHTNIICNNGDLEITKLLLKHGADPYIKNYGGHTPLDFCKNKEEFLNLIRMVKLKELYK